MMYCWDTQADFSHTRTHTLNNSLLAADCCSEYNKLQFIALVRFVLCYDRTPPDFDRETDLREDSRCWLPLVYCRCSLKHMELRYLLRDGSKSYRLN